MKKLNLIFFIVVAASIASCKKKTIKKELVNGSYTIQNFVKPYSESRWNSSLSGDLVINNKVGTNSWRETDYPDSGGGSGGTWEYDHEVVINSSSISFTEEDEFTYKVNATGNVGGNTLYQYDSEQSGTYEILSENEIQLNFETTNSTLLLEHYDETGVFIFTGERTPINASNFVGVSVIYKMESTPETLSLIVDETDEKPSAYEDTDIGYNLGHIFLIHDGLLELKFTK